MAKGSGGSVYLIGLIFAILVAMGLLMVAYKLNEDLTAIQGKIQAAEDKYQRENERVKVLNQEIKEIRKLVHGRPNDAVEYSHYKTTILDPANDKLKEILAQEWITTGDFQNIDDEQLKNAWQTISAHEGKDQPYTNLNDLFYEIYFQLTAVTHLIPHLRVKRVLAKEEVASVETRLQEEISQLQEEINNLTNERNRLQDENIRTAQRFDLEKRRLQEDKDNILAERARLERDFKISEARLDSQIGQLESRIQELTKKQERGFAENSNADGEVVYADSDLGYAWIDLGQVHGLRRNTRFQVYQFVKGGRQKIKGVVEVRRVEEDMAQCAIIEDVEIFHPITGERLQLPDPEDPIVKGDLIRNPFFDAEERKVFVFLGTEPQNRYYTLGEMREKIEEFGGRVDREVSIESHFVVLFGAREDDTDMADQIRQASQFGVIFMSERELLEYLGR